MEEISKFESTPQGDVKFKKSFFKNVLISGGYNYLAQGITFLSTIILARLLSPQNYGVVGLITVFTGFISVFSDSGISLAVIKSDYGHTYHKALDNIAMYMGVGLFLITSIIAYPLGLFYGNNHIVIPTIILATTFILKSLVIVRMALLSKNLEFGFLGKVILLNTLITIVLTVALAYYGAEYYSLIIPQVVVALINIPIFESKVKLKYSLCSFRNIKVAFRYTKGIIGSLIGFNVINYWARNSDNLIVGKVYGVGDLGIYNRAYSLLTLPLTLISGLMGTVLYPSLKKLKNEGGEIHSEYLFVLKLITFIVFPISFIFIIFPHPLVLLLWGKSWVKVGDLLPYFGLLILSQSLLSTSGNILVLQGKEKALMYSGWVGAFFIILSIILGSLISLVSIAQFYSIFFIVLVLPFNIVYVFYKSLKFDLKLLLRFWSPVIGASVGIWLACYFDIYILKLSLLLLLLFNNLLGSHKQLGRLFSSVVNKIELKFNIH
jgi:O-antigen/teichoic acid export membrane protein